MKIIYSKEEMSALQEVVDSVIDKVNETFPDSDVERENLVEKLKEEASKAVVANELPNGDVEIDINVEYAIELIDLYKDTFLQIIPIVKLVADTLETTKARFINILTKWI